MVETPRLRRAENTHRSTMNHQLPQSSERDRRATSLGTRRSYILVNRAAGWLGGVGGRRRGPGTGGPASAGAGGGEAAHITALVAGSRKASFMTRPERSEVEAGARGCMLHFPSRGAGVALFWLLDEQAEEGGRKDELACPARGQTNFLASASLRGSAR